MPSSGNTTSDPVNTQGKTGDQPTDLKEKEPETSVTTNTVPEHPVERPVNHEGSPAVDPAEDPVVDPQQQHNDRDDDGDDDGGAGAAAGQGQLGRREDVLWQQLVAGRGHQIARSYQDSETVIKGRKKEYNSAVLNKAAHVGRKYGADAVKWTPRVLDGITDLGLGVSEAAHFSQSRIFGGSSEEKESAQNIAGTIAGYSAFGSSTFKFARDCFFWHRNAAKFRASKNKNQRDLKKAEISSNILSLVASASGGTATGLNLWGDKDNDDSTKASAWLKGIGALAGLGGNIATSVADHKRRKMHRAIAGEARKKIKDDIITAGILRVLEEKKARGSALSANEKQQRSNLKAKRDAMAMAAVMNKAKVSYNDTKLGILSSSLSIVKSGFGILSAHNLFDVGPAMGLLSLMAGGVATGMKYAGMHAKDRADKAVAADTISAKKTFVNKYIESKADKIAREIAEASNDQNSEIARTIQASGDIQKNEIKRIIVGRMGLKNTITNTPLDDNEYSAAFKLLAERRAQNILESDDKADMIKALGISYDPQNLPTKEELSAAIMGELS